MQPQIGPPDPGIRPMVVADLEACVDVFFEALDEFHQRVGQPLEERHPDAMMHTMSSLLHTDAATSWVAHSAEGVVAFGQAVRRGDLAHLSFLFVRPSHQGRGLGRRVLELCLPGATSIGDGPGGGQRLSVGVEALQPVSTALYAGYGMVPRVPMYTLVGVIRPDALPGLAPGIRARPFSAMAGEGPEAAGSATAVAAIDVGAYGFARPEDHLLARQTGRVGYLFVDESGQARGYGYVLESGRLAPTVVDDARLLPGVMGFLVRTCDPATPWRVGLTGPNPAFRLLLAAGLRIEGPPTIYCANWPGPPYERMVPTGLALP